MKKVCLLVLVLVTSGCMHAASVKQEKLKLSPAVVSQVIAKGKTTKEEVIAKLGLPNSVDKHPYHVPKITAPGFKMEIPPAFMAVETWNYWDYYSTSPGMAADRALMVKVYIDETGKALDYEISYKDLK